MRIHVLMAGATALALSACDAGGEAQSPVSEEALAEIPETLAPFGDGYPNSGDPCRQLGESEATSNYLDDSAVLVGCPTEASAEALGGNMVGNIEGVRLVSLPMGDTNTGMSENGTPPVPESDDALVPGTEYNATSTIKCGMGGMAPTQMCSVGVIRNWQEDGSNLVDVTRPDGTKRALFFNGTEPVGADSAQADGSAGWDFESSRDGDRITIKYGPETYVIVEALITGG